MRHLTLSIIFIVALMAILSVFFVGAASASVTQYLFVPSYNSNAVTVIDTATDNIVTTIQTQNAPRSISLNPAGSYLYVLDIQNRIEIFSTYDWTLKASVYPWAEGNGFTAVAYSICLDPTGAYAYATVTSAGSINDSVRKIDLGTFKEVSNTTLGTPNTVGPRQMIYYYESDPSTFLYAVAGTKSANYSVNVIVNGQTYFRATSTTQAPSYMDGDPNIGGGNYYVAMYNNQSLDVFTSSGLSKTYPIAYKPYSVAVGRFNKSEVYVAGAGTVSAIDPNHAGGSTGYLWNLTISTAGDALMGGMITDYLNDRLYVALSNNTVCVISTTNHTVIKYIQVSTLFTSYPQAVLDVGIINTQTTSQIVQIKVVDQTGIWVGANIPVQVWQNGAPGVGQLVYTSQTDDSGIVTFTLLPTVSYVFYINDGHNINIQRTITPTNNFYTIYVPTLMVLGLGVLDSIFTSQQSLAKNIYGIYTQFNITTGTALINASFENDTVGVTGCWFTLYKDNTTINGIPIYVDSVFCSGFTSIANFTVLGAAGHSFTMKFNPTNATGGRSNQIFYSSVSFPGPTVLPGFPPLWYFIFSTLIVMLLFGAGVATKKGIIGIIGVAAASIFNIWGWYSTYISVAAMWTIIAVCFVLCVIMMVSERERYT